MRKETDHALMKALASELKGRRASLGISEDELAFRAEVNRTFIGKIEVAANHPALSVLLRIAEGLQALIPEIIEAVLKRQSQENLTVAKKSRNEIAYWNRVICAIGGYSYLPVLV